MCNVVNCFSAVVSYVFVKMFFYGMEKLKIGSGWNKSGYEE